MSPLGRAPSSRTPSFRLALFVGSLVAVVGIAGAVLFQRGTEFTASAQIRAELARLATAAALSVDGDLLRELPETVAVDDPRYQQLIAPLAAFHKSFPQLYYVYTARRDPQHNFRLVLDTANVLKDAFPNRALDASPHGEIYDFPDPAMVSCFETSKPSYSPAPYTDNFGTFLTGCAPIRDSAGTVVGIVGVDISLSDYSESLAWTWWAFGIALAIALLAGGFVGLITWIMARRWARAEALASDILECHSGFILRTRPDGTIIFVNPALALLLGCRERRPAGHNLGDLLSSDNAMLLESLTGIPKDNGRTSDFEAPLHGRDRKVRIIRWRCRPGFDDENGAYMQSVGDDVTELRTAQERVIESELRHRLMVEGASDIVSLLTADGIFLYQSPAIKRVLGYDETELIGKKVDEIVHPDDVKSVYWALKFITDGREIAGRRWRIRYIHKSGATVILESTCHNRLDHPALRAIVVNSRDVTENHRVLEELDRQNRLLIQSQSAARIGAVAFDKATSALFWTDESYKIMDVSPERFTLTTESAMKFFEGRVKKKLRVAMMRCAVRGTPFDIVVPAKTATGREIVVRTIGLPRMRRNSIAGIYGSMQDVTDVQRQQEERDRLEEQMRQSQRLESLGVLAGGIAHDFNNLLTGILGNASLLSLDYLHSGGEPKALRQIELSARRAADLCRQLVSYSGQRAVDSKPVEIDSLINETSDLVAHSISKKAKFTIVASAGGATVMADPTQIQQVVMNLVINASESLANGEGAVTIRTGIVDSDSMSLAGFHIAPEKFHGKYLSIEVSDTGCGIPGETLTHIFDPFFTTKFTGRGLGLAAVRGIVRAHGGALNVTSTPKVGTTFNIYLPLHGSPTTNGGNGAPDGVARNSHTWNVDGNILVSDDEETIRLLTRQLLRKHGFKVHAASNGEEALEQFYEQDGDFAAAVLDITMPKLGGVEVLRAIRSTHPTLPVLMMSGYSELGGRLDSMRDRYTAFLGKPFSAAEFTETLKSVMARAPVS